MTTGFSNSTVSKRPASFSNFKNAKNNLFLANSILGTLANVIPTIQVHLQQLKLAMPITMFVLLTSNIDCAIPPLYVFGSYRVDAELEESEITYDDHHFTEEFDYNPGKRCPCLLILDSTYIAFFILALGFCDAFTRVRDPK